jgi:hypothetical protein
MGDGDILPGRFLRLLIELLKLPHPLLHRLPPITMSPILSPLPNNLMEKWTDLWSIT